MDALLRKTAFWSGIDIDIVDEMEIDFVFMLEFIVFFAFSSYFVSTSFSVLWFWNEWTFSHSWLSWLSGIVIAAFDEMLNDVDTAHILLSVGSVNYSAFGSRFWLSFALSTGIQIRFLFRRQSSLNNFFLLHCYFLLSLRFRFTPVHIFVDGDNIVKNVVSVGISGIFSLNGCRFRLRCFMGGVDGQFVDFGWW